jgi:hypothetical protein
MYFCSRFRMHHYFCHLKSSIIFLDTFAMAKSIQKDKILDQKNLPKTVSYLPLYT